jgi:hypothetical protein
VMGCDVKIIFVDRQTGEETWHYTKKFIAGHTE